MKKKDKIQKLEADIRNIQQELEFLKEEQEPKFEVGKWYKGFIRKGIIAFCESNDIPKGFKGYGINDDGVWIESIDWLSNTDPIIEATKEEVEKALIKEAKRRGFKDGVKLKRSGINTEFDWDLKVNGDKIHLTLFYCLDSGDGFLFKDGKWAEIIEESKVTLNGYDMEVEGDVVKFGCAKFYKEFFRRTLKNIRDLNCADSFGSSNEDLQNKTIKSIKLDSGVEITVEKLKEIVDALK